MALVRMKHLELIALSSARSALLRELSRLGCVEIAEPEGTAAELLPAVSESAAVREKLARVQAAIEVLGKYAPGKGGLFSHPRRVKEGELFDPAQLERALALAEEVLDLDRGLLKTHGDEARLRDRAAAMRPWKGLDIPLGTQSGKSLSVMFMTAPSASKFADITAAVTCAADTAEIFLSSSDRELHYFLVLCHGTQEADVADALRQYGANRVQFGGGLSTAAQECARIEGEVEKTAAARAALKKALLEKGGGMEALENASDALGILLRRELACESLRATEKTVHLTGWLPEGEVGRVSAVLDGCGAAYEIRDPAEEEEPPVLPYSMKLFNPFGMITNMYSPPSYRGIDPNPFMALFFSLFFGIMLSDAAYGLIMVLAGAVVLLKFKPRGGIRDAMIIVTMCGISTFVWGALFGGFFGDAVASVYKLATGETFTTDLALWFNPLNDPIKMLVFSFVLGGIHIFAGMAIKAYMLIRDGHFWDAVFDIGFWWLALAGLVFMLLGLMPIGAGLAIAGAVGLLLTQGRHEKKLIKKLTKGISSLYDITSYLGDLLSYSRLMALNLATAVVASVMNTMGVMTGPVGFVIVFIIGHTFNLAINLIGSYVHTARLQYVEFFGKFYESGGSLFDPLDTKTKYTDIIKEEI